MCVYEKVSKRGINNLKTISLKGGFSDAQHFEKLKRLVNLSPPHISSLLTHTRAYPWQQWGIVRE